jgi:hypothetical protein
MSGRSVRSGGVAMSATSGLEGERSRVPAHSSTLPGATQTEAVPGQQTRPPAQWQSSSGLMVLVQPTNPSSVITRAARMVPPGARISNSRADKHALVFARVCSARV